MSFLDLVLLALLAWLWHKVGRMGGHIARLEARLRQLDLRRAEEASAPVAPAVDAAMAAAAQPPGQPAPPPLPAMEHTDPAVIAAAAPPAVADARPASAPLPAPAGPAAPVAPGWWDVLAGRVRDWFTSGNVPVKVGMLVLLAGVGALLKYLGDQGLLTTPIELKLAAVAVAALGMLGFGWRQRIWRPLFALALQGGAIGVLLLTVFAAFRLHGLIDAVPALLASVLLVAGLCLLAVIQHSRTLAVLGILAGFMAPVWLSTGSGNHVALFSYYALLNLGVLAIAWWRPWRVLNLLGFAFTFGVGTLWGVLDYRPAHYDSTQPFLLLFLVFYLLIPLLYARRQPAVAGDRIDGTLVFGTPLIAFSLQAGLMPQAMGLALCALGLAALYAGLAWAFIRRPRYAALARCWAVLAVGFATLAVPLALSASATASVFALEGAALVWLGLHQQRRLPQLAGALLQAAAGFAWLLAISDGSQATLALVNPVFIGAILLALAGGISSVYCHRHGRALPALAYYLWALGWLTLAVGGEIFHFLGREQHADAWLVQAAMTAWLAAEAGRRWSLQALRITAVAALLLLMPLMLLQVTVHQQPFAGWGGLAWLVVLLAGARALQCLRQGRGWLPLLAHYIWWAVWACALSICLWVVVGRLPAGGSWGSAAAILPWLLLAVLLQWRWPLLCAPLQAAHRHGRHWMQGAVAAVLLCWWLWQVNARGAVAPLPWIPLLNPLELALWATLALPLLWLHGQPGLLPARARTGAAAAAVLLLLSTSALRAVHHLGGVGWSSVLGSVPGQTSLTLLWSVLGMAGWIAGSRRGNRNVWLAGAVLMAVVLLKLLLVDRSHLGNLLGIASFIGYGLLATVVGYFAPVPPRTAATSPGGPQ